MSRLTVWWGGTDSNHRRQCRQIYSLLPLATREPPQGLLLTQGKNLAQRFPNPLLKCGAHHSKLDLAVKHFSTKNSASVDVLDVSPKI